MIPVAVEITDDADEAVRRHARLRVHDRAMGSRDQNFYNAAFTRQGLGDDVRAVQELWLAGRRDEAADRVPLELGANTNLIGTADMIADRRRRHRPADYGTAWCW